MKLARGVLAHFSFRLGLDIMSKLSSAIKGKLEPFARQVNVKAG
jgi:hypothetical protein